MDVRVSNCVKARVKTMGLFYKGIFPLEIRNSYLTKCVKAVMLMFLHCRHKIFHLFRNIDVYRFNQLYGDNSLICMLQKSFLSKFDYFLRNKLQASETITWRTGALEGSGHELLQKYSEFEQWSSGFNIIQRTPCTTLTSWLSLWAKSHRSGH